MLCALNSCISDSHDGGSSNRKYRSMLTSDVESVINNPYGVIKYMQDPHNGGDLYIMEIGDRRDTTASDFIQIAICLPKSEEIRQELPEGTYKCVEVGKWNSIEPAFYAATDSKEPCGSWFFAARKNGENIKSAPIHDGMITVKKMSQKEWKVIFDLKDDCSEPNTHSIRCEWRGRLNFEISNDFVLTTLTGDHTLNLEGEIGTVKYNGEIYKWKNVVSWQFGLGRPNIGKHDYMTIELLMPKGNSAYEIPTGEFPVSAGFEPCTVVAGSSTDEGQALHTWLFYKFDNNEGGQGLVCSLFAACKDGIIRISKEGSNLYVFELEFYDELRNKIQGSWKGYFGNIEK